jgi:glycosyltransferase involved in cell wall biosynthesis
MKRIGIVLFKYILGYSPLVINTALILESEGYEVNIFIDTPTYERGKIDFYGKNIVIHTVDNTRVTAAKAAQTGSWNKLTYAFGPEGVLRGLGLHQSLLKSLVAQTETLYGRLSYRGYRLFYESGTSNKKLRRQTADFFPDLFEFYEEITQYIDETYTCLLAVDTKGLIAATMVAQDRSPKRRLPTVYYNMELLLEKHANTLPLLVLKSLERICTETSYFIVIQDEERGAYFAEDNHVPKDKLVYVPVSGLRAKYQDRSDCFRTLFDISPDKKILLHAGHIVPSNMCRELAEAANDWGDDLVLVLHSPTPYPDSTYLDRITRIARADKVYISLSPVEWERLPDLISSADIGLMFYKDLDPNFCEIGRSSNKLVQYLQVGLPIITVDFPSLKKLLKECRCGESTNNPRKIEALARQILSDYDTYRNRSFTCYTERYNISHYFSAVLERIRQIE